MTEPNNPFERVNHSTNFEDYAISSSNEPNFDHKTGLNTDSNTTQTILNDCLTNSFNKICLKTPKFESLVTPMISTHFSIDQKDNKFLDSCLSAGTSSAEVTPVGTPQSSPYSMRKVMENKKLMSTSDKKNTLSANPKRWFYSGLFNSEAKPGVDNKMSTVEKIVGSSQIPRNPSFKNLCVSNFDINAVGPTSW